MEEICTGCGYLLSELDKEKTKGSNLCSDCFRCLKCNKSIEEISLFAFNYHKGVCEDCEIAIVEELSLLFRDFLTTESKKPEKLNRIFEYMEKYKITTDQACDYVRKEALNYIEKETEGVISEEDIASIREYIQNLMLSDEVIRHIKNELQYLSQLMLITQK